MVQRKKRPRFRYLPIDAVIPPSAPLRREADLHSLADLTAGILRFGMLSPLTVRRKKRGLYELVCGSRRLSAAKLAGLERVPCVVVSPSAEESAAMWLAENYQRLEPDFLEEADTFRGLTERGVTPERIEELTGIPAGRVLESLRALNLPRSFLSRIREHRLTAGHALALAKLPEDAFEEAFADVLRFGFDGETTEKYVAALSKAPEKTAPALPVRDARVFLNTVERGVDTMRRGGVDVGYEKADREGGLVLTIKLPGEG